MNAQQALDELTAHEAQRGAALVNRDRAALEALLSDDLVHIHSTGIQMNKAELLDYVTNVLQFLSVTRAELSIKLIGEGAILTGRMRTSMRRVDNPEPVTAESIVTQVWVRVPGGWRQSHFHACRAA